MHPSYGLEARSVQYQWKRQNAKIRQATSDPHLPTTINKLFLVEPDLNQGEVADGVHVHDDDPSDAFAQLNPLNVIKLLHYLTSITESRGAILACSPPWLKCLLLQHSSGVVSQDFSLHAWNSLYQVIDEEVDEVQTVAAIYEYKDDSEEESEDLETDQDYEQQSDLAFDDGLSDIEGQIY